MEKKMPTASIIGAVLGTLIWTLAFKFGVEFWTAQFGHFQHVSIWPALLAGFLMPGKVMYPLSAFTFCYWLLT